MHTEILRSFDFSAGGNARAIQINGWAGAERDRTWSLGKHSALAIDNVIAPCGFFLELEWEPFTAYPDLLDQSVILTVDDRQLRPYRLSRDEVAAFYCPPLAEGRRITITFDCHDAARVSDYFDSNDKRVIAIALKRLRILTLTAPLCAPLRNRSAVKARLRENIVIGETPRGPMRLELRELASQFEMLAGNCDLGLALRDVGVEQLSFLRFAGATSAVAVRGLDTRFDGIGEKLSTEIADNPIREWMIRDAFGLRYHTDQSSDVMTEGEVLERQRRHLDLLRRKFLEDAEAGEKIFVYADHIRPGSVEAAIALFLALNRYGARRLLWVTPNQGETEPGRVDELIPGLARASLDRFDGPLAAGHIAVSGWLNVLFNAAIVLGNRH